MPYAGHYFMQREITAFAATLWPNRKVEATAVELAEAKGCVGAWHDNYALSSMLTASIDDHLYEHPHQMEGTTTVEARAEASSALLLAAGETLKSRDCGLWQINIPASQVDTDAEGKLRSTSDVPEEYERVARNNAEAAYDLYASPWIRNGERTTRQWQPWVAYTSGWALYPEAWVWHRDFATGEPVGPWVKTGRTLHQAIRAVANWNLVTNHTWGTNMAEASKKAIAEAERLADIYGITRGALAYEARRGVYWNYPPAPAEPPRDPARAYPVRNDGTSFLTARASRTP